MNFVVGVIVNLMRLNRMAMCAIVVGLFMLPKGELLSLEDIIVSIGALTIAVMTSTVVFTTIGCVMKVDYISGGDA